MHQQDYVLNEKDGKKVPEKVGLKSVMRDGVDYEFTLVFDVDIKHFAVSSKDRTGLFMGKPDFVISENTGKQILEWCNAGSNVQPINGEAPISTKTPAPVNMQKPRDLPKINPADAFKCSNDKDSFVPSQNLANTTEQEVYEAIGGCKTIQELISLYRAFPQFQEGLRVDFEAKKSLIMNLTNPNNFSQNGKSKFK